MAERSEYLMVVPQDKQAEASQLIEGMGASVSYGPGGKARITADGGPAVVDKIAVEVHKMLAGVAAPPPPKEEEPAPAPKKRKKKEAE